MKSISFIVKPRVVQCSLCCWTGSHPLLPVIIWGFSLLLFLPFFFFFSFSPALHSNSLFRLSCWDALHSGDWNSIWKVGRGNLPCWKCERFPVAVSSVWVEQWCPGSWSTASVFLLHSTTWVGAEDKNALMCQIILWLWWVPRGGHIVPNSIVNAESGLVCSSCSQSCSGHFEGR